jgi:transposase
MSKDRHRLSIEHDYVRRAERREAMWQDYEDGMPVKEIMDKYDVSAGLVYRTATRDGVVSNRNKKWSEDEKRRVVQAYADGWPVRLICDRYECDRKSVWKWVVEMKVPLRKGKRDVSVPSSDHGSADGLGDLRSVAAVGGSPADGAEGAPPSRLRRETGSDQ